MMTQERPGAIEKTRRNTVWKRRLWLIRKSPLTLIGGAIMLIMLFLMIFSPDCYVLSHLYIVAA